MSEISKKNGNVVIWLRQDLRLEYHPAIQKALSLNQNMFFVYIFDTQSEGDWPLGEASLWWLKNSLSALSKDLFKKKNRLIIRQGSTKEHLLDILNTTQSTEVYYSKRYEPHAKRFENKIADALSQAGYKTKGFPGQARVEPDALLNLSQKPYLVFTPYYKAWLNQNSNEIKYTWPSNLCTESLLPQSLQIENISEFKNKRWENQLAQHWQPGEHFAQKIFDEFLNDKLLRYKQGRDFMAHDSISRLSPYLQFGEISVGYLYETLSKWATLHPDCSEAASAYIRQLAWRDFSISLLWHFEHTAEKALQTKFDSFPYQKNQKHLKAWQMGQTGYPIVDAGMRELWQSGFMHNRVRMIVASFLTKDLLLPWQWGARYFWDTLVDAHLANNTQGWQWTAGCGADPSPFFRIFNPTLQSEKFDPLGLYIQKWVPELKNLPPKWIHKPFLASKDILEQAGVELGKNYPHPMVDHARAREQALQEYRLLT